jgi:hypothetical protein
MKKLCIQLLLHSALSMIGLILSENATAQTWGAPVLIGTPATGGTFGQVGYYSTLLVVNGNPAMAYQDQGRGDLVYVRATDAQGTAWDTPVVIDNIGKVGGHISMSIVNGNPAISYLDENNGDLKYVRTTNASGTAWAVPITIDVTGHVGLYTNLVVANGNPAICYYDQTNSDLKYVRATNALGTAWATPITVDAAFAGTHASVRIVNGNPAVSYLDEFNLDLKYVRATDASGTSWAAPITLDAIGNVGQYTSLEVVNGFPAVSYRDGTNLDLKYIRATDASGTSWGTPVPVDGNAGSAGLGAYTSLETVNGNPAISYHDNTNGDLKYVRATDISGTTWATPIIIDGDGAPGGLNVGRYSSLTIVDGNPAIAHVDQGNSNLKYVRANNASGAVLADWSTPPIVIDAPGQVGAGSGKYTSLQLVGGNPAISCYDDTNGDLIFVRATNSSGTSWGAPVIADGTTAVSNGETSLFIVNGNPAISYYGASNDLYYVRANDALGTSWGTPISIHSALAAGQFSSLAVVNGNPAISFYSATGTSLKFIRASDVNGTSWPPTSIAAAPIVGNVGQYTSLEIVNGFPAISYYDVTNLDLKYVRATDVNGTAWGTPISVDATGSVGQHTSLKIVNGNPAISYYDLTNTDLKYVRATDVSGTVWGTPIIVDAAAGQYSSLAIVDGNPAISYHVNSLSALRYVRSTDVSGIAWATPVTLDNTAANIGFGQGLIPIGTGAGIAYWNQGENLPGYVMTCTPPTIPTLSATSTAICQGNSTTLSIIVGTLNGAADWKWYSGSCGGIPLGSGASLVISPSVTTTYYARGEGGCTASGACASITVTVNSTPATPGTLTGAATICSGTTNTYTIAAVPGATSYIWALPSGWTGTSTTASITTTANATSGNITVAANNTCGTSAAQTLAITVNSIPAQPGIISGNTPICSGISNTYSIAAVSGATSYIWTLPSGWTGTSTTNSITTTASTTSGNVSVTANNTCGTSTARTLAITVSSIPPQPGGISGTTEICAGSSNTYSIAAVSGATSYTWTLPGGWTGTSTTNSITAMASTTSGNVSVTANNTCGTSTARTRAITVDSAPPATPGIISSSNGNVICSSSTTTFTITAVSGAASYVWLFPSGWTGISTTNSITATASTTSGNVSVAAYNTCGSSTPQALAITVNTIPPAVPGAITGNSNVCSGSLSTYSVGSVSSATSYTWTLPNGWTGTSTTTSITTIASATSGNISVTANNPCGSSAVQALAVTVSGSIAQPGVITGNTTICLGSLNTYTVAAVGGATSYTWTLPNGWTGTSTTTSITTTASATSGTVSVAANNALCGSSAAQTLAVSVNTIPVQPGTVAGNTTICSGSSNTYSIAAVNGATSYTWTLPSGWTGTSTTASITATANSTSGNVSVIANNICGTSPTQVLAVMVGIPDQPGTISGNTSICSASSNTYTIADVGGATSYTWSLPNGWTGTSTINSISAVASTTSGNISVTANNTCGSSTAQTLAVTVNNIPAQPGAITGNVTLCSGSTNTYTISAVGGATSYAWTLPNGWTGTSTTTFITAAANATSGNISVTANNTCGTSMPKTLSVSANATPAKPTISVSTTNPEAPMLSASGGTTGFQWYRNGVTISGATSSTHTVTTEGSYTVQVTVNGCVSEISNAQTIIITGDGKLNHLGNEIYLYPNPTSNTLIISLRQFKAGDEVNISVSDLLGRLMETTKGVGGADKEINVGSFPSGKYIVLLQQAKQKIAAQFIKSN